MTTCEQALQQVANQKPHSGYIAFYVESGERDVVLQVAQVNNLRNEEMFRRVVTTIDHLEKRHHLSIHWKVWKDKVKPQQKVPQILRLSTEDHVAPAAPLTAKEIAKWPKRVKPLIKTVREQPFICSEKTPLATFQANLRTEWNRLRQQNYKASICTIVAGTAYVACTSIGQMKEWLQQSSLSPTLCLTVPLRVGFSRNKKEAIAQLNEWTSEKLADSKTKVKVKPLTDALFLKRTKPFHVKRMERTQKESLLLEAHLTEREVKEQLIASIDAAPRAKLFLLSSGTDIIHLGQVHDLKEWLHTSSNDSSVTRTHIRVDWVTNKKEALVIANEQIKATPSSLGKWKVKPFTRSVSSSLFVEKNNEQPRSIIVTPTNEVQTITVEENERLNREKVRSNQSPLEHSVTKGTPREQRNRARTIAETKTKGLVNVYVDGSYLPNVGISAYGFVAEDESGIEVQKDFGMTVEERLRELGSLGAELHACLRGIEWAIANNYQTVRIYYDFIGIIQKLQEEQSKTKHERMYFGLYEMYSEHIRILFRKVSPSGKEGRAHLRAHDLSRLPSTLYMN